MEILFIIPNIRLFDKSLLFLSVGRKIYELKSLTSVFNLLPCLWAFIYIFICGYTIHSLRKRISYWIEWLNIYDWFKVKLVGIPPQRKKITEATHLSGPSESLGNPGLGRGNFVELFTLDIPPAWITMQTLQGRKNIPNMFFQWQYLRIFYCRKRDGTEKKWN